MVKKLDTKIAQIQSDANVEVDKLHRELLSDISAARDVSDTEIQSILNKANKKISDYKKSGDWAFAMTVIVGICGVFGIYAKGLGYLNNLMTLIMLGGASVVMPVGMITKLVTNHKAKNIEAQTQNTKRELEMNLYDKERSLNREYQNQASRIRENARAEIQRQVNRLTVRGVVPNEKFGGIDADNFASARIKLNEMSRALSVAQELADAKSQAEINKIFGKHPEIHPSQRRNLIVLAEKEEYNKFFYDALKVQENVKNIEKAFSRKNKERLDQFKAEHPRKYARIRAKSQER